MLEVACGTGYWTQHLAKTAARLVATDGTAEPLAFARLRPGTGEVTERGAGRGLVILVGVVGSLTGLAALLTLLR